MIESFYKIIYWLEIFNGVCNPSGSFIMKEFFNISLLKTSKYSFELPFFKKDRDWALLLVFVWLKVLGSYNFIKLDRCDFK